MSPKKNRLLGRWRRLLQEEQAQAMVLMVMSTSVLLLMAGLGVDVGYLRYQKQQMQKAADAGALAGAATLIYSGNYVNAARNDAAANGFTSGTNGVSVAVNNPPTSGTFAGNAKYVEVIVSQPRPTFFMRVANFRSVAVAARAVASAAQSASGCIYALDPVDPSSFLVDGNVTISSTCGIFVNSDSPTAIRKNGASGTVTASAIAVVGGYSGTGFSPMPVTGIAPFSDPLSGIPAPAVGACDYIGKKITSNVATTLNPGVYCDGITIHGNGSVVFQPGLYTIVGGIDVSGGPTLTGNGVTFYLTGNHTYPYSGISMHGNEVASFSAPTDDSHGGIPGILFFQDRSLPVGSAGSTFGGTSGQGYVGALYFPTTTLTYKGTPDLLTTETIMVGWQLDFRGDTLVQNYTLLPDGGGPIKTSLLVE